MRGDDAQRRGQGSRLRRFRRAEGKPDRVERAGQTSRETRPRRAPTRAIFAGATAIGLNALAWAYVAGRAGHMLCYYLDQRLARSAFFVVSLLALVGMLVVGIAAGIR